MHYKAGADWVFQPDASGRRKMHLPQASLYILQQATRLPFHHSSKEPEAAGLQGP